MYDSERELFVAGEHQVLVEVGHDAVHLDQLNYDVLLPEALGHDIQVC